MRFARNAATSRRRRYWAGGDEPRTGRKSQIFSKSTSLLRRACAPMLDPASAIRRRLAVPLLREATHHGRLDGTARNLPVIFAPEVVKLLEDLRDPISVGDTKRSALPRDRGQEPADRSRQPAQVRILGQHVA